MATTIDRALRSGRFKKPREDGTVRGTENLPGLRHRGVLAALSAALLFGFAAPAAKTLLGAGVSPWLLAGLLYAGSGVGLTAYRLLVRRPRQRIVRGQLPRLAGVVVLGGIAGPVLLMLGLTQIPAAQASLLLTTEGVLTAVLAWTLFREHVTRSLAFGMVLIVAGAALLAIGGADKPQLSWGAAAVVAACGCWALDNNLTRDLTALDATWLAAVKGLIAGPVNLVLALASGATLPPASAIFAAAILGLASYGISIVLFIAALRQIGTARTGAYFGLAPFVGAAVAAMLGEQLTGAMLAAGALMAAGTYLHLGERHEHQHRHHPVTHTHEHCRDEHHQHAHGPGVAGAKKHSHPHAHEEISHSHPHYPDIHHRHRH